MHDGDEATGTTSVEPSKTRRATICVSNTTVSAASSSQFSFRPRLPSLPQSALAPIPYMPSTSSNLVYYDLNAGGIVSTTPRRPSSGNGLKIANNLGHPISTPASPANLVLSNGSSMFNNDGSLNMDMMEKAKSRLLTLAKSVQQTQPSQSHGLNELAPRPATSLSTSKPSHLNLDPFAFNRHQPRDSQHGNLDGSSSLPVSPRFKETDQHALPLQSPKSLKKSSNHHTMKRTWSFHGSPPATASQRIPSITGKSGSFMHHLPPQALTDAYPFLRTDTPVISTRAMHPMPNNPNVPVRLHDDMVGNDMTSPPSGAQTPMERVASWILPHMVTSKLNQTPGRIMGRQASHMKTNSGNTADSGAILSNSADALSFSDIGGKVYWEDGISEWTARDGTVEAMDYDTTPLWGWGLLIATAMTFVFGTYAMIVSKWMSDTGSRFFDAIKYDAYYCYAASSLLPVFVYFVIINWLGLKYFRHN